MTHLDLIDLSTTEFRFVTKRDALPTNYIHFSIAPLKQSIKQPTGQTASQTSAEEISQLSSITISNEPSVPVLDKEKMYALLSPFGRLVGLSIKQSAKGGYAQYEHSHSAGTAITSINQSIQFGGKMLLTFAALRGSSIYHSASSSTDQSKVTQSSNKMIDHLNVLSALRLYKNLVNDTFGQTAAESTEASSNPFSDLVSGLAKPMFHFGAALEDEDDRFGLPAPKPMNPSISNSISQLVDVINHGYHEDTETSPEQSVDYSTQISAKAPKNLTNLYTPPSTPIHLSAQQDTNQALNQSNSVPDSSTPSQATNHSMLPLFDRITYQSLMPGAGIKPQLIDDDQFDRAFALMVVDSSLMIDVYHSVIQPGHQSSNQFITSIVLPSNSLLIVPAIVSANYSIGVAYRTRDLINDQSIKRSKVSVLKFLKVRTPDSFDPLVDRAANQSIKLSQPKSKQRLGLTANNRKIVSSALPANLSMLQSTDPSKLERLHVQDVYDTIASHFSSTRHSPWPRVEAYVRGLTGGLLIADIACGNGKYMGLNQNVKMIGCDLSQPLVDICVKKGYAAVVGDCMALPWADNMFDGAISVALLHHISSADRRKLALSEMLRVVKPGSQVLVTAWAMEQDETSRRKFESQDVLVPWKLPSKFKPSEMEQANNEANRQATTKPDDSVECQRYCHVYTEGEIEGLLGEIGGNRVVERYYDRGNWVVIFAKHTCEEV